MAEDEAPTEELEPEETELELEVETLIGMLKFEVGLKWMSFELRMQIERIELLLGLTGYSG